MAMNPYPMSLTRAARLYLLHVVEGVTPNGLAGLADLKEAQEVVKAAGLTYKDVPALRIAAAR